MKRGVEQLRRSRRSSEERTRLHRIGETLRNRLALSLQMALPSDQPGINVVLGGHTDQFNRILVLWLDLNRAVTEARFASQSEHESELVPWGGEVPEITRLWEQITRPKNLAALLEWLRQSASGEAEIWAQQALKECQLRSEEENS